MAQALPEHVKLARKASLPSQDLKAECHSVKRLLERKSLNLETVTEFLQFLEPYKDAFYRLYKLVQIAVNLPISSAGCESSFTKLRMIKTYIRNSMADTRLGLEMTPNNIHDNQTPVSFESSNRSCKL